MVARIGTSVAVWLLIIGTPAAFPEDKKDLVDTAVEGGQFKTLVAALESAGMVETLRGKGPLTLLAPTDEAFQKLPEAQLKALLADREKLKKVLAAHLATGKDLRAADLAKMNGKTVNGFLVKARADKVTIGKATVTKADITCSNGVIQVIDTVLMPD